MKKHKEATAQEQSCAVASFLFFRVERTDQNEDSADHIDCRDRSRARRPLGSSGSALVGDGGFEPPKALPADLQSVPFGHSGNPPYAIGLNLKADGAGRRTRTPDLLITNQLLYQLSYTSDSNEHGYYTPGFWNCQALFFSFAKIRFSKNLPVSACPGRAGADSGRGIIPDSASGAAAPS